MIRRLAFALAVAALSFVTLSAGTATAADECKGLRTCLPVQGPWVAVPAGGVDYELRCPVKGYIVAGTDARVAAKDVDVSFSARLGSPVGPGVTTRRSVVFHAVRARAGAGRSSFQPYIGCIPTQGGGGRALTGVVATAPGIKPTQPLQSVFVNKRIRTPSATVRLACPARTRLVGSTHATAFRQTSPPSQAQLAAVSVRRFVVDGVLVARVTAIAVEGTGAEVQIRALCARVA